MSIKNKTDLKQFTKDELIFYIHYIRPVGYVYRSPEEIILQKRIDDNHKKVDELLNQTSELSNKLSAMIKKYNGNIPFEMLDEYLKISSEIDIIGKSIDKCWSENDKYSKILYGDDKDV